MFMGSKYLPKLRLRPGLHPRPAGGAYSGPPHPYLDLNGSFRGGKRRAVERAGRMETEMAEGKGEEGWDGKTVEGGGWRGKGVGGFCLPLQEFLCAPMTAESVTAQHSESAFLCQHQVHLTG